MPKIICIDAGHGGNNLGAKVYPDTELSKMLPHEKDINLYLARLVYRNLSILHNILPVMTRIVDMNVDNDDRIKIAQAYNADLFISLHFNSSTDKKVNGCEVWYRHGCRFSRSDAEKINNRLKELGRRDRGVREAEPEDRRSHILLPDYNIPAVLIETEFISSKEAVEWLYNIMGGIPTLSMIANKICQGIMECL